MIPYRTESVCCHSALFVVQAVAKISVSGSRAVERLNQAACIAGISSCGGGGGGAQDQDALYSRISLEFVQFADVEVGFAAGCHSSHHT